MCKDENRQPAEEALTMEKSSWLEDAAEIAIEVLGEVLESVIDAVT